VNAVRGRQLIGVLCLVLLVAGCASSSQRSGSSAPTSSPKATPRAVAMPAACQAWHCRARETRQLGNDAAVTLWVAPGQQNFRSRPMLSLSTQGVPVQWWVLPKGDGWNGSLTCLATTQEPNCVVVDSLGMHASVGELVLLRDGHLVPAAEAVADAPGMNAVDLDRDGYLDVIATVNDYTPNFAQGHNYWQTRRYSAGRFLVTGCALQQQGLPAPTQLLTGACPPAP
jgi:hypothetical protein